MTKIYKNLLSLIGLFILILYIWLRFIRVRMPREIPLKLSFYGMVIITIICSILIYSLFYKFFNNKNGEGKNLFYEFILTPLKEFDLYIKTFINPENFLYNFLKEKPKRISFLMISFGLFPRIVISLVLLIETFYFHYLSFLYKIIILGIFVLIEKYVFFSLSTYKEDLIIEIEKKLQISLSLKNVLEMFEIFPEIKSQYYDEEEEDYILDEAMVVPLREYIKYQEIKFNETAVF